MKLQSPAKKALTVNGIHMGRTFKINSYKCHRREKVNNVVQPLFVKSNNGNKTYHMKTDNKRFFLTVFMQQYKKNF